MTYDRQSMMKPKHPLAHFKIGNYYRPLNIINDYENQAVLVTATLYAVPLPIPETITIDRICAHVQTGEAGKSIMFGIYSDKRDGSAYPGPLLLDGGAVVCAAAGIKEVTVNTQLKGGYLYWLAFISDNAGTLQLYVRSLSHAMPLLGHATALNASAQNVNAALAYPAAMPNPFTAGGGYGTQAWAVGFRIKSIP